MFVKFRPNAMGVRGGYSGTRVPGVNTYAGSEFRIRAYNRIARNSVLGIPGIATAFAKSETVPGYPGTRVHVYPGREGCMHEV
eukprot:1827371-Rhodomonas_salina.1